MLSNSNIENQNIINSNNVSGFSSGSLLCNSLTLTDGTTTNTLDESDGLEILKQSIQQLI